MSVYGLDISRDMLEAAKNVLGTSYDQCNIEVGSADNLPYDNNQFDVIISCRFFTLISLDMARKVLAEFQRVTKSIVVLNIKFKKDSAIKQSRWLNIKEKLLYFLGITPSWVKKRNMKDYITEKELRHTFESFGFKITDKITINENDSSDYSFFILKKQ